MKVSVIGTGYVGLVSGTCFAEIGHDVTCIDIDESKVTKLKAGISPIYEIGLEPMIQENIKENRLHFSTGYESVTKAKTIFLAVGTPSSDSGKAELKYLFSALEGIIPFLQKDAVVVVKSTVPVGTGKQVKEFLVSHGKSDVFVVNNPEFLKEGTAVEDFMKPERIIIGAQDQKAFKIMEELYDYFNKPQKRTIQMSNLSAEMTKYAANCFLATKVSFMNEIAKLCDQVGADIEEVKGGIATDSRIGAKFLNPGPGYGGSCFPKDVKALVYTAKENNITLKIVEATEDVNKEQKLYMANKIKKYFGSLEGKTLTLWGVAFKANTDDIRETSAIYTAMEILSAGGKVRFYDPEAADNYLAFMSQNNLVVEKANDKYEALKDSDGLVILTDWDEFKSPDLIKVKEQLKTQVIFDARNLLNTREVKDAGFDYFAIGKLV